MKNTAEEDLKYMKAALDQACMAAERDEVPIGAVVVSGGEIIARGYNMTETLSDPTAHAEMQVITSAAARLGGKYLDKCTLYVTVEPCPMCASALYWAHLERLVYGSADPKRGYTTVVGELLHPKTEVVKGIMEYECGEIVSDFFSRIRKKAL